VWCEVVTKVAFQGERGAFSEDAVIAFFGDVELSPSRYIDDVFEAVLRDEVDFGVVPAENSQAGSINDTYDLLLSYPLNIFGEIHLRISHCLMTLPGESLDGIRVIYSHPQALAQCEQFLRKLKAEIVPTYDTAGSAKSIKETGLKGCAAVANKRAAQIYGLEILAENIETNVNNYTRFFVISKKKAEPVPRSKTSLVFGTKNVAGALYACLGAFATRDINLTKLESRPSRDKPWEYIFYVDFEGYIDDPVCQEALIELKQNTNFIKVLGCYPRAED
jgi:prephenate dehydratase